jgi:hypothetical protein
MSQKKTINIVALYPQINQIKNSDLRNAVIAVWQALWDQSSWSDPAQIPTSSEISYPNLPHTQCVVTLCLSMADALEHHHGTPINRDYLIAGAVLQDASKVVEYAPGPEGKAIKSAIGRQFPHGFWCAHLAIEKGIPYEICHVMLTHSSSAAQFPSTLEGKILYFADQLDVIAIHGDRWKKHLLIGKQS